MLTELNLIIRSNTTTNDGDQIIRLEPIPYLTGRVCYRLVLSSGQIVKSEHRERFPLVPLSFFLTPSFPSLSPFPFPLPPLRSRST